MIFVFPRVPRTLFTRFWMEKFLLLGWTNPLKSLAQQQMINAIQNYQPFGLFSVNLSQIKCIWLVPVCSHWSLPMTVMHHNFSLNEISFYKQPQLTIVQQQQRAHYLHPVSEHLNPFNWSPSSCLLLSQYFIHIYENLLRQRWKNGKYY